MTAWNLPGEAGSGPEWEEAVKGREHRAAGPFRPSACSRRDTLLETGRTDGLGVLRRGELEQVARVAEWR